MSDFVVLDLGTTWSFHATSPEAKREVDEHFGLESWQLLGGPYHFAIDHRVAAAVVGQLYERGFSVGTT